MCSSVTEMWWQGKENNMVMYWFRSHCCDTLFQQYQCKAERVYFNSQFQEQFTVVGKSKWQKAEVAVVTPHLQACRSAPSFHLQSPGPKPPEWYHPWQASLPTSTSIIKIIFHRHTPMPLSQVILDSSLQLTLTIEGKSRQVSRLLHSCLAMVSESISVRVGFDFLCSLCQSSGNWSTDRKPAVW